MLSKQTLFKRGSEADSGLSAKPIPASTLNVAKPLTPAATPSYSPEVPAAVSAPAATPAASEHKTGDALQSDPASGSRLIVGPDVKLKGAEILDCDTLVVEGRVEATMDSRVIKVAADGAFSGKVGIDIAEIHGKFDGELTARSQLIIHATGKVSGKIRYGKILIEEGGELSGDVAALTPENVKTANLRIANSSASAEE